MNNCECLWRGQIPSALRTDYGFSNLEVMLTLNESSFVGVVEAKILFGMGLRENRGWS